MKAKTAKLIKSIDVDQLGYWTLYFVLFATSAFQIVNSIFPGTFSESTIAIWDTPVTLAFFSSLFFILIKKIDDLRRSFIHDTD